MTTPAVRRLEPATPYEVCVFRTRTGEVVDWIPFVGTPRWQRGLNISGSWSVDPTLDERYLPKAQLNSYLDPWYWSWAIVQGGHIFQAGPVVSEQFSDDGSNSTSVNGVGIWTLLKDKRVLVNADRQVTSDVLSFDADMAFGTGTITDKGSPIPVERRDLSLHTISKRLVENELAKTGGTLPIDVPVIDIAGTEVREFLGPELSSTGGKLFELTQGDGGPEIEFVPFFSGSARTLIHWRMDIGNPRLGQLGYQHSWTYRKAVTKLGFSNDGDRMTDRCWDRGAGFDRNVKTGFNENLDGISTGAFQTRPLLETVGNAHTGSDNEDELGAYASSEVLNGRSSELVLDLEVTLDGDIGGGEAAPSPSLVVVSPGDTAVVWVKDHPRLPDGVYEVRVLRMSNGSAYRTGKLEVEVLGRTTT